MNTVTLSKNNLASYGVVELSKKEKNETGGGAFWFAALQAVALTGGIGAIILAGAAAGYGAYLLIEAIRDM